MSNGRLAPLVRERGDLFSRVLLAALQLVAIAWFSPGRGLPLDDAWIHQVVARTFAETGTLGYAPGQHGAAATSYLWAALLAVDFKALHLGPGRWALILNGLAALTTGQLLHSLIDRARAPEIGALEWRATSFFTTLLACLSPNLLWFTCSGMEAMPLVALSLTAIWAATSDDAGPKRTLVTGLAAGALALLRPEAVPLGGLLVLHAFARRGKRNALVIGAPWLAAVALYVGSNLAKTGHALPSTLAGRRWLWLDMSGGLSRMDQALDFLDAWATRLGSYTFDASRAVIWVLVGIAAYGALRLARPRAQDPTRRLAHDAPKLLIAWALFHAAFYALLLPTPGHGGRYQPLTPLLFLTCLPIGVAFLLRDLARIFGVPERVRFGWFAACALVPWVALEAPVLGSLREANALAVAHIHATELGAGAYLNELPEGNVASFDIGGSGFVARRRVLDLGGLSDPSTAALLANGRLASWLESNKVRWVVLPQSYDTTLPVFEDYRTRLHLADNASIELEAVRAFETPFDKWVPAIRATWNAAPKQVVYEVRYVPGAKAPLELPLIARDARRSIADPAHLAPRRERIVTEHMLASLEAWSLPVDVRLTAGPVSRGNSPCAVVLGWWGIAVDGCAAAGDAGLIQAMAYEQAGRYLDIGDIGGALRSIPHVLAQARRRIDPTFQPPLAPLMPPTAGGTRESPMAAGRFGLAIALGVLFVALAIDLAARRNARLGSLVARLRPRAPSLPVTTLLGVIVLSAGCGRRDDDVAGALARGRGAVEIAIANGGGVNEDPSSHRVPLIEAASIGDAEIIALLLARGARVDVHAPDGATPIHLAARRGHHAATVLLIAALPATGDARRATLDATAGPRKRTALHEATLAGSLDTVQALLSAGADASKADAFGQTALHHLATVDAPRAAAIAPRLFGPSSELERKDARGFTALHAAAVTDNAPLLRLLLDRHGAALIGLQTPTGETALDLALRYGRDRASELLLREGASPTHKNALPPLHQAARMDALERAASLLAAGVDLTRKVDDRTALDVAVASGSKRVEALLRERSP